MPALERIFCRGTQLSKGRSSAFAELYIELDGSNSVFVPVHELLSSSPSFFHNPGGSVFHRRRQISLVHTWFGASGVRLRLSKFFAIGSLCLLSVAIKNLLFPRTVMPWRCIFLTRCLPTRIPRATSSFRISGQPYSCFTSAWMVLICTSKASSLMRWLVPGLRGLVMALRQRCSKKPLALTAKASQVNVTGHKVLCFPINVYFTAITEPSTP
jgi:hypothetical protein